jgi:WD40 repeat protein
VRLVIDHKCDAGIVGAGLLTGVSQANQNVMNHRHGTVELWRVADGALLRTVEHSNSVFQVAFTPDGQMLASSAGGMVRLWAVR